MPRNPLEYIAVEFCINLNENPTTQAKPICHLRR